MSRISLSGLDLTFLKTNPLPKSEDKATSDELTESKRSTLYVLPDLDSVYGGGFVSPIDGSYITSRSQLREHNLKHGVIQAGDTVEGCRGLREITNKRLEEFNKWKAKHAASNPGHWGKPSGNLTEI